MADKYSKTILALILCFVFLFFSFDEGLAKSSKKSSHHRKHSTAQSVKIGKNKGALVLRSAAVIVKDQQTGKLLIQKKAKTVMPIASITKLMTAMVVLDAGLDLDETVTIEAEDVDRIFNTSSRLPVGAELTREETLLIALMSSDNRCAHALGRTYPGGYREAIRAMNAKARSLGLKNTYFRDTIGLSSGNVSSARDLAKLVDAAYEYELIREFTTRKNAAIYIGWQRIRFRNTNQLIRDSDWKIGLSKTGFTNDAGRCLVMQVKVAKRPLLIVLLDSRNNRTRISDANRIKSWLEAKSHAQQT